MSYATHWKISLEQNNRVFKNKSNLVERIVESIVWLVSEWVSKRKEFDGISLEDINRSWAAVFKGGWSLACKSS